MIIKTLYLILLTLVFTLTAFAKSGPEEKINKKPQTMKHHDAKEKGEHRNHKKGHNHDHKTDHKMGAEVTKITPTSALIKVQGMVCAFCAQGIEKNFNKLPEVKETKVDLDKMEVLISYKKGKTLSQKKIEETVTGAGFLFKGITNAQ